MQSDETVSASQRNETRKAPRPQNGLPFKERLGLKPHSGPWVCGAVRARSTRFASRDLQRPGIAV